MTQHTVQEHFLHAFQQFWRTDPGLHLLAALCRSACLDCRAIQGWTKGGCLVAARGIQRYIANSLKDTVADLRVSLVAVATDETEAAHVLVKLCKDGAERFLDASGVWTREELLERFAQEYQYDAWSLVPWKHVVLARVRIPFDASIAQSVEKALAQALGPFPPACVFSMPDLLAASSQRRFALCSP
jgi:hypothetical protein